MNSAFKKWFIAQFKQDTMSEFEFRKLIDDVKKQKLKLSRLETRLKEELELRDKHQAALYAWNVKDSDKNIERDW